MCGGGGGGGDGLQIRKVPTPEVCYPNFFSKFWYTETAFPAFLEALIELHYNVHDLKSMFDHVRNPLKTNMS